MDTKFGNDLPPIDAPNDGSCLQLQQRYRHTSFGRAPVCIQRGQTPHRARHSESKHVACPQCSRKFVTRNGLYEHVKRKHENQARYRCEVCGKGYSRLSHYHDHRATHTGVKRNVCPACSKQFTFKSGLKAHVLRFHPNEAAQILQPL